MAKDNVDKTTKWTVISVENYDMSKVLEWLLNNSGGYDFWHGNDLVEADIRDLFYWCKKEFGLDEQETLYNLWLLNRYDIITLKGFTGDKGTEFSFFVDMNYLDGDYMGIKVWEEK